MATTRKAAAHWEGSLLEGKGQVSFNSSDLGQYSVTWAARSAEPAGQTSPEELIAGAHSTCYSMALSHALAQAGNPPTTVDTAAEVDFQPGTGIHRDPAERARRRSRPDRRAVRRVRAAGQGGLPGLAGAQGRADQP